MTGDSTVEGSPWQAPSGSPTASGAAPAPPVSDPYATVPPAAGPLPGYGAGPFRGYGPPPRPGNGLALGALWTGVGSLALGFLSVGVLGIGGGIVGLILGAVALRRISRGTATGSETATFGMALSLISIAIGAILLFSAWPTLVDTFEQGWDEGWEQGQP